MALLREPTNIIFPDAFRPDPSATPSTPNSSSTLTPNSVGLIVGFFVDITVVVAVMLYFCIKRQCKPLSGEANPREPWQMYVLSVHIRKNTTKDMRTGLVLLLIVNMEPILMSLSLIGSA